MNPQTMLTQGQIEAAIMELCEELETETYRYADVADLAAEAEADFKYEQARALIAFAAEPTLKNAQQRDAHATVHTKDWLRTYKLTEARRAASREALLSIRARLDALRTLSANVRAQS